ncbi:type II 3-dehydroquinate dehydratase [Mesoaciditoga sp.]
MKIHVINGPNLNMLSKRDPNIYGTTGYEEMVKRIKNWCDENDVDVDFFQSNHEGDIIDYIQKLPNDDAIVINPGAFAHYSYAIRDALEIFKGIKVEVHISNVFKREEFRTHSVTAPVCNGVISGLGIEGYILAAQFILSPN